MSSACHNIVSNDDSTNHHESGFGHLLGGLQVFTTDFTALNNSGVDGQALLLLDAGSHTLTVHIEAEGLEPGQVHPQHIHGFSDDTDAVSPTLAQDDDHDGFVELGEGIDTYGPIQLNLTQNSEAGSFPTADEHGVLRYTETFHLDGSDESSQAILDGITPLEAKEIVLHGLTLQEGQGMGDGEADGTQGYKAVLPVASGELHEVGVQDLLALALHGLGSHDSGLQVFTTDFTALNNSGVDGQALLLLDAGSHTLTVHIEAEGLEPGQVHPQHIHGFSDDTDAVSPTLAQDDDHDGFVELGEGIDTYGPIQLNLTQNSEAGSFPTADEHGVLRYTETFHLDGSDESSQAILDGITPLEAKEIVLHGLTLQEGQGMGDGEADGTQGYKAVLPVASGELHEVDGSALILSALLQSDFGGVHDWAFGAA